MKSLNKTPKDTLLSIAFLVLVPTLAHLMFSSLGFNPTDDGFILAYSRRLLEGQIPHRDFISIRPPLSPLLHTPFVLLGGDYTYWVSRFFVWFQLACIAWIWISVLERLLKQSFKVVEKVSIALISFVVSLHTIPIIAWHTFDGLFLISIGLALCVTQKPINKLIGYLLISVAYLCKQNFIFAAPLILIILGDWRKVKYWLAILAPGTLYVIFLGLTNALPAAVLQLSSEHDIFSAGVRAYLNLKVLFGVPVGYFSIRLATGSPKIAFPLNKSVREWFGLLMLLVVPLLGMATFFVSGTLIVPPWFFWSFGLFGLVAGVIGYFFIEETERPADQVRFGLLALITSWSASLSTGYNSPALVSGQLLAVLFAYLYPTIHRKLNRVAYTLSLAFFTAIVLLSFAVARVRFIYKDQAAPRLSKALDGVLPGGNWIRTNVNTYQFLVDLQRATKVALDSAKLYAIIPDCAGYWVKAPEANPLPIDWPQHIELNNQQLVDMVIHTLNAKRSAEVVIVQKVEAEVLADGFHPLGNREEVVKYVRHEFRKVYETHLFDLYR